MTYFLFIIKSAFEDFNRNKIKTFLTSLGITIGVSSVVLLIALGLGLKAYIQDQFDTFGTNNIYVIPGSLSGGFQGGPPTTQLFDDKDVTSLKRISNIDNTIPVYEKYMKVEGPLETKTYQVTTSSEEIFAPLTLKIQYGQLYTKSDVSKGAKKIVLGPNVAEKLYGSGPNAIGKSATINGSAYKIIGVFEAKGGGSFGGPSVDDSIYMPITASLSFNPTKKYASIYLKVRDASFIPTVKKQAAEALLKRYKKDEFSVIEQTELIKTIDSIFNVLNTVLIAIAAISLVVGGVGIMNIMYMSVVERIREIGIRRAIGATKKDILYQFMSEAILLSGIGGLMGLLFSWIVVLILRTQFPAYINASTVAIALGVSSGVGILFGVFPAKKAADLSPMDAIRYE
jgi:putative ABC transport system permease protein